jgi:hypothetical protein
MGGTLGGGEDGGRGESFTLALDSSAPTLDPTPHTDVSSLSLSIVIGLVGPCDTQRSGQILPFPSAMNDGSYSSYSRSSTSSVVRVRPSYLFVSVGCIHRRSAQGMRNKCFIQFSTIPNQSRTPRGVLLPAIWEYLAYATYRVFV